MSRNESESGSDDEPGSIKMYGGFFYADEYGHIRNEPRPQSGLRRWVCEDVSPGTPAGGRIERLDWRVVIPYGVKTRKIETAFFYLLHPDEAKAAFIWSETAPLAMPFPYLEVVCHNSAWKLNRRDWIRPADENEMASLEIDRVRELTLMTQNIAVDTYVSANSKKAKQKSLNLLQAKGVFESEAVETQVEIQTIAQLAKDGKREQAQAILDRIKPKLTALVTGHRFKEKGNYWYLGIKVDLNRQFRPGDDDKTWDNIYQKITYPEARLLLEMAKNFPDLRWVIGIHQDQDCGFKDKAKPKLPDPRDGSYFYDTPGDARQDPLKPVIDELAANLAGSMTGQGFTLFNGIDDPSDPDLGYAAVNGKIDKPIIDAEGKWKTDGSLESALVALGILGLLPKMERSMCIEIPAGLTGQRKKLMVRDYQDQLVIPFIRANY